MAEQTFLQTPNILITSHRVVCGVTTYATAQITSVEVIVDASLRNRGVFLHFCGILMVLYGVSGPFAGVITVGSVMALAGILMVIFGTKRVVRFVLSSGQEQNLSLNTQEGMNGLAAAISQAIVAAH